MEVDIIRRKAKDGDEVEKKNRREAKKKKFLSKKVSFQLSIFAKIIKILYV